MKTISLNGIFGWEITAQNFKAKIKEDSKEKLRILLNSPGGDPYEAFEMYNIVKAYKGEVEIVIGAMAASAASYFAMSVPLENRKGFKNSSAMIHEAQAGARGKAKDLKVLASVMEGVNNILAEAYAEGMRGDKEDIFKKMDATHYMTGWEQLVDNNFISDIIDAKDIEIPDEPVEQEVMIMFMSALEKTPDVNNIKALVDIATAKVDMNMYTKIAALLKPESQPEVIPVVDNITTEEKMNLQEFLKANPEAKAEYDDNLLSAIEKGRAENVNVQAKIAKILTLEGVTISPEAKAAIDGSMAIEDYKDSIILAQKNKRADKPDTSLFAGLVAKQTPQDQDPEGSAGAVVAFDKDAVRAQAKKMIEELGV
jgi:ATP-dependent protease ClpP protease subunit